MTILEEFRNALLNCITVFKAEKAAQGNFLSVECQEDIQKFTILLEVSKSKNQRDAVLLREEVVLFVEKLPVYPLWLCNMLPMFFSSDSSDLQNRINGVLENPHYSKRILRSRERAETKEREEAIFPYLQDAQKVGRLLEEVRVLKQELAKKEILLEEKEADLAEQDKSNQAFAEDVQKLWAENRKLISENTRLKEQIADLKEQQKTTPQRIPYAYRTLLKQ